MQKKIVSFLFLLIAVSGRINKTTAQDYPGTKEKIYAQSNHVFFKPGDVMYCKFYVVKAADNTPTRVSRIVYTEIIGPSGTVVQKSSLPVQHGYAEGSFDLPEQYPGGVYKLRAFTSWMQNEKDSTFFIKEFTLLNAIAPRVLMKLDFPEKGYGPGSLVKADFSMRNLNDQPISHYDGKYKVNIGGKTIVTQSFKTDQGGKAVIGFSLPADLSVNDGLLTITIDYDSYTESISRSIPIILNRIDLQFMPEGGTLVQGLGSHIAFKALNENGKAADIKGELRDENGRKVAAFESYHSGMGRFYFIPEAGHCYKAVITSPASIKEQYDFPFAAVSGVVMHIQKDTGNINVSLICTRPMNARLEVNSRNNNYFSKPVHLSKGLNELAIDETVFPAGIMQFTLFGEDEMPLAERLVFTGEKKHLYVRISPDKKKYLPREKVCLIIKTTDENGLPVPSGLSLAVIDDKLWTYADDKQDHILSWLLLGSELKGKIEEPQFYFKDDEPKAIPALDLLMMTHGYRYFDYIDYVVKEKQLKYLPDQDHIVSGQVVNAEGKAVRAKMFMISSVPGGKALPITTDENGLFFFSDLLPGNKYYLFAQSFNRKEKVNINVLQNGLGYNPAQRKELKLPAEKPFFMPGTTGAFTPLAKALQEKNPNGFLHEDNVMLGTEVVVTALGQTRQARELGFAATRVRANELGQAINLQNGLTGRVAGLQVVQRANEFDDTRIILRGIRSLTGNNQPLIVLNGIPMEQFGLNTLNPNDIESVTILKDASATALYGSRAANGALIIETKKLRRNNVYLNFGNPYYYATRQFYAAGNSFTPVRRFYIPKYESTLTDERTDFRETIYWNPVVQTDRNGTATVEFYNSDASSTFRAIAEGIGFNGDPGRTETTYSVQNPISVDIKIPPYLTVGDKALLPMVIKNNSVVEQTFSIEIAVPENFKRGDYASHPTIRPGQSLQLLVPMEAIRPAVGTIQFSVSSQLGKEKYSFPVIAADKGFPVKLMISGNVSATHDFAIGKMIPGSLSAQLKLFKTLEGQLLDGIESMLREPYGCFEQTSSTTYPNIFILKYLKESGRVNKDIEQKALGYIQRGYQRLVGYETSQDGFEWFGKTPPHEALTAYGLLEFTDMQEFIDVDKKMLERTKKFLLSRRDGNGSFKLINHGLDQFAAVPDKIAGIYIVYALTQAGIGKEIQKEYTTAVEKALKNDDAYQLSMMAIAASNMKDAASYNRLMEALGKQVSGLNSETSVVNSRDASLRVETNSLYAMALMKAPAPDLVAVASLISKTLGEKSYYGYGSTQATVLALQAMVQYSRLVGHISDDAAVAFLMNENTVASYDSIASFVKEGANTFSVTYPQKEKAIPYGLEISYSTFTPPNSEKAELKIRTTLKTDQTKVGETVRMDIEIANERNSLQPMAIAKVGIPAGLSVQPWQLKEIIEKNEAAYYELFDNYLVFYWMGFRSNETKTIHLDLKADVPGEYKAKASTAYLYYTPEYKNWAEGLEINIRN